MNSRLMVSSPTRGDSARRSGVSGVSFESARFEVGDWHEDKMAFAGLGPDVGAIE
jgi:hypothetical protein